MLSSLLSTLSKGGDILDTTEILKQEQITRKMGESLPT